MNTCPRGTNASPCSEPLPYGDHAAAICLWCRRAYHRCENHGGFKGAKRSLSAHKGICPRRPSDCITAVRP